MKKIFILLTIITTFLSLNIGVVSAGKVNGNYAKIRTYEKGRLVYFESKIPNVRIITRKVDVLKGMTKIGKTRTIVEIERNGLLVDIDKKVGATLDRVGDGLFIRAGNITMFVSERELDDVRKMK